MLSEIKSIKEYPNLSWTWNKDIPYVSGIYHFKGENNGIILKDDFRIKISFPKDYPCTIPQVFELDGKIGLNYHHFQSDSSLCLGTEIDLYMIFANNPCIDTFMNDILNPYLYRWLYIQKFGKEPWADRSHGNKGIIESYAELLNIPTDKEIVNCFLYLLLENKTRANSLCPCNSGKKVKCCHKKKLEKLFKKVPQQIFLQNLFSLRRK